jgi:hypothetical protein
VSKRPEFPTLEKAMEEYQKLLEAKKLLDDIYAEIGGYGRTVSDQLHMRLNDFYGFDDSE